MPAQFSFDEAEEPEHQHKHNLVCRSDFVKCFSALDPKGTGRIKAEKMRALMKHLRMEDADINRLFDNCTQDGLVDYHTFLDWILSEGPRSRSRSRLPSEVTAANFTKDLAEDLANQPTDMIFAPEYSLDEVFGKIMSQAVIAAMKPENVAGIDWEDLAMRRLGGLPGVEATRVVKELLLSGAVLDKVAAQVVEVAEAVHNTGLPPHPRHFDASMARKKQSVVDRLKTTHTTTPGRVVTQRTNATTRTKGKSGHDFSSSVYVGSYGLLTGFIRQCHEEGCDPLMDKDFEQLISSVENLSRHGSGEAVTKDHSHFSGCEQGLAEYLPAMGISVERAPQVKAHEGLLHEESFAIDAVASSMSFTEVFNTFIFDKRSRTDINADVHALVYAFSSPTDLVRRYRIDKNTLATWIKNIAVQYNSNPYHNWQHAFDILQFTYYMLHEGGAESFFNHQDILATMIAHIGHDVAHTGTNNAFLVKSGHPLAIEYNDQSPLENMHASFVFKTFAMENSRVLQNLSDHDYENVRSKIVVSILATDMSKHLEFVDRFTARVSKQEDDPFHTETKDNRERQKQSKADRRMLLQAFIHMADLGHCCRDWSIHKHLVVALEEEFFLQGDQEMALGMPVMPMMNRNKDSAATGQEFFLEKLVYPLLDPYCHFIQPEVAEKLKDNLEDNVDNWQELVKQHGKLKASQLVAIEDGELDPAEAAKTLPPK